MHHVEAREGGHVDRGEPRGTVNNGPGRRRGIFVDCATDLLYFTCFFLYSFDFPPKITKKMWVTNFFHLFLFSLFIHS
jgi:hypothetical protein